MEWLAGSKHDLSALAPDPARQLNVLRHDGDTFGVDGAQIGVLEEAHQVRLAGLLQSHDRRTLETKIGLEVLSYLTHEPLEGQLADQELCALLVATDLTERHRSGPVAMRFLDAARGGGALASRLGGELLPGRLAAGRFTGRLLGTSHFKQTKQPTHTTN